jgi:hypothetical protein
MIVIMKAFGVHSSFWLHDHERVGSAVAVADMTLARGRHLALLVSSQTTGHRPPATN